MMKTKSISYHAGCPVFVAAEYATNRNWFRRRKQREITMGTAQEISMNLLTSSCL
jgi:hypothetical protein